MNFKILIVELHVVIIYFMLTKFQENQKSIVISLIKCLNFKFYRLKLCKKISVLMNSE